ncbi:MAG: hypothetical protein M0P71_03745 [Melioribacteraceae bacterium]|nr:hypothetical protein [Melioribacteraceae bacterium]
MKVVNYFFRKPAKQSRNDFSRSEPRREDSERPLPKEKINQKDVIEAEFEEIKSDQK